MPVVTKVIKSGNSDVVTLPSWWKKAHNVETGDLLEVRVLDDGGIAFIPCKDVEIADRGNIPLDLTPDNRIRASASEKEAIDEITAMSMETIAHAR